jgi:hypothetical protein
MRDTRPANLYMARIYFFKFRAFVKLIIPLLVPSSCYTNLSSLENVDLTLRIHNGVIHGKNTQATAQATERSRVGSKKSVFALA